MLRLPASLERRLSQMFPTARERERFVASLIEESLDAREEEGPAQVGGTLHLFTDGGSRGNPGQSAIAGILEDPVRGVVLEEFSESIGIETNNVAEYRALIEGLHVALGYHPNRLICHLDSELIVRQLNGQYQVKMPSLKPYVDTVHSLSAQLPDIVFTHIPRKDNYRADALVNRALDALPSSKAPSRIPPPGYSPPQLFPEDRFRRNSLP